MKKDETHSKRQKKRRREQRNNKKRHEEKAERFKHHLVVHDGESDDEDWLRKVHYLAEAGDAAEQESSSEGSVGCTDACCADIDAYGREVPARGGDGGSSEGAVVCRADFEEHGPADEDGSQTRFQAAFENSRPAEKKAAEAREALNKCRTAPEDGGRSKNDDAAAEDDDDAADEDDDNDKKKVAGQYAYLSRPLLPKRTHPFYQKTKQSRPSPTPPCHPVKNPPKPSIPF